MEIPVIEDFAYHIACSKENFDLLKTDERFLGLLTFARSVNALRFCQKTAIDTKGSRKNNFTFSHLILRLSSVDLHSRSPRNSSLFLWLRSFRSAKSNLNLSENSVKFFYANPKDAGVPAGARSQRINSFLFTSSVLYEGFLTVERQGKAFKDLDSYRNGFGVLLKDKSVQSLRQSVLQRMRNKFVFHFDRDVAKEAFDHFQLPEYKFASGIGKASGEMYFGLADEAVMNYLMQPANNEPDESVKARYKKIVQETTQLMGRFTESSERLMADAIEGMGFTLATGQ